MTTKPKSHMSKSVKPCPFCGGKALTKIRSVLNNGYPYYHVEIRCGGVCNLRMLDANKNASMQRVIKKWNNRAELKQP